MRRLACRLSGWQWGLEELMAGCMELDVLPLSLCLWPVLCLVYTVYSNMKKESSDQGLRLRWPLPTGG